jgi:hypothetical protein
MSNTFLSLLLSVRRAGMSHFSSARQSGARRGCSCPQDRTALGEATGARTGPDQGNGQGRADRSSGAQETQAMSILGANVRRRLVGLRQARPGGSHGKTRRKVGSEGKANAWRRAWEDAWHELGMTLFM